MSQHPAIRVYNAACQSESERRKRSPTGKRVCNAIWAPLPFATTYIACRKKIGAAFGPGDWPLMIRAHALASVIQANRAGV